MINNLLIIIFLLAPSLKAVQRFSVSERIKDMKDHQEELDYEKKVVDKDIEQSEIILKTIYPSYKNLDTQFRSLHTDIEQIETKIKKYKETEEELKNQIRETTTQLINAKKKIYLSGKFNKKIPHFLSSGNKNEAVKKAVIRLETKEKIIYQQIQQIRETIKENEGRISFMKTRMAEIKPTLIENRNKYKSAQQIYGDLKDQRKEYSNQKEDLQRDVEKYLQNLPLRTGLFNKPLLIQPALGDFEVLKEDYNTFHSGGAVINSHSGEDVISPSNGNVVFIGPLRKFGNIILIDHGLNWHSLISGVQPKTSIGQQVKRGQIIGKVSEELGGRVYFELMKEGRTRIVTFH